jgi:hypothetical protein
MRFPKLKFSGYLFSLLVLFVFTFFTVLAIKLTSPPSPQGINAPSNIFSAARAFIHIEKIAQQPHMVGTPEKEFVCNYLATELERIGLEVDVQSTTVADSDGFPVFANVTNVVGRIRGVDSTKALLVVGHYDTQPNTPGAADDGMAVGAMLEAASILKNQFDLQNDIIFLFTDAEEVGLLGAQAFAKEHPWISDVAMVLNLEARGNKGTALAFEVSPQNGWIIKEFARGMERPYAGSMMYEVYKMIPNNTDFTVFKNLGLSGFNVAIVDGFANYHSPTDTPENLSLASLQHIGSYLMSFAQHFGNISLNDTKSSDLVYFNFLGHRMICFPSSFSIWILVFIGLLFFFFLILGLARKHLSFGKIFISLIYLLAVAGLSIGAVWGLNELILKIYPHYGAFYMGNFYNVGYYFVAYSLIVLLLLTLLYPFFLKRFHLYNTIASVFSLFIILSGIIIWKLPTASYLTLVPLLFGLLSVIILLFVDIERDKRPWVYHLVILVGLLPTIFMLSPYISLIYIVFGLSKPYAGAVLLIILLLFALPLLEYPLAKLRRTLPFALLLSTLVVLVLAHIQSKPTANKPLQSNVMYAVSNDTQKAYWLSSNVTTDDWNSQFFADDSLGDVTAFYPWRHKKFLKSDAEYRVFEKPIIEMVYDSVRTESRVAEFILKSQIDPVMIELIFPWESKLKTIWVNGKKIAKLDTDYIKQIEHYRFRLFAPSYGGDKVKLEYHGIDSLSFSVIEVALGFPDFDKVDPMPTHIIPGTGFESSVTVVKTTTTLPYKELVD